MNDLDLAQNLINRYRGTRGLDLRHTSFISPKYAQQIIDEGILLEDLPYKVVKRLADVERANRLDAIMNDQHFMDFVGHFGGLMEQLQQEELSKGTAVSKRRYERWYAPAIGELNHLVSDNSELMSQLYRIYVDTKEHDLG